MYDRFIDQNMEEDHLTSGECEVYGDIRRQFGDLDNIENLTNFFEEVLKKRDILEEKNSK